MDNQEDFNAKMRSFFHRLKKLITIDRDDIFMFISLGMIFTGFYLYKPFLAWIIVGFLLLGISAFAAKK